MVGFRACGRSACAPFREQVTSREIKSFVLREREWMLRQARRIAHNRDDAEDLVQHACEMALRSSDESDPATTPRGWIITVMVNRFVDVCRAQRTRHEAHERLRREQVSEAFLEELREDYQGVTFEVVLGAASSLNPTNRDAFLLRERDKLRYKQIAEQLDITVGSVKTRIKRARDELAILFGRKPGDEAS